MTFVARIFPESDYQSQGRAWMAATDALETLDRCKSAQRVDDPRWTIQAVARTTGWLTIRLSGTFFVMEA
jgi:hypothetical protein